MIRPRRSLLYMPGSNARALEKAKSLAADGFIFDLEDAVAPEKKGEAREQVRAALKDRGAFGPREIIIRVNGLDTPWGHDDLAMVARSGADGVLLPKVESDDMVRRAQAILAGRDAPAGLGLWCMMETPRAMLRAEEIAGAGLKLAGFVMGTSDLARELDCAHTPLRLPMLTALGLCLLAARAEGLAIIDGVHLDLEDADGLAESCQQGRELGFDGKTLIHPKQIEAANRAFGPSAEAVAEARRVIDAHREAAAAGRGVTVLDGRLIENLHVTMAERTLELAAAIERLEGKGQD